jgi:hypothetical protein
MTASASAAAELPDRKPARRGHFDNRELSTIAMLAALNFAVSFASRLVDGLLMTVLGPFFIYVAGIGDEGLPCLLIAVAVTLVPKIGTAGLSLAVVWLLYGIVTGTFSVVNLETIAASILLHEAGLVLCGVTIFHPAPAARPSWLIVLRTSLAIGAANGLAMFMSYVVFMHQMGREFDSWYVLSAAVLVGAAYGAIGAAIGTVWGYQLRRTAP